MMIQPKRQCVICKEPIDEKKEKWVRLTDFYCETKTGEVFNHLECWRERFMITNSERKKIMYSNMATVLKDAKDNLGGSEEVIVIR